MKSRSIFLLLVTSTTSKCYAAAFVAKPSPTSFHHRVQKRTFDAVTSVGMTTKSIDAALSEEMAADLLNNNKRSSRSSQHRNESILQNMHTILDDGNGHMNAELARSIWDWENSQRLQQKDEQLDLFPAAQLQFSTREGLRLVDSLAAEIIIDQQDQRSNHFDTIETYSDLVQEGVVALMSAMAQFDPTKEGEGEDNRDDNSLRFEKFAKAEIEKAMKKVLVEGVREQNRFLPKLQLQQEDSTVPTSTSSLSRKEVKSTKKTIDEGQKKEVEVEPHDQIVAPLRNFIAEDNPTPEDIALIDMIQHDISEFLERTLNETELKIIRLKFALDSNTKTALDDGLSSVDIAEELGLDLGTVEGIEEMALDKLRTSFGNDYIGAYLDDDHSEEVSL